MQTIYIIQGTTGEYSDRHDWIVRAYNNKEQALAVQMDLTDTFAKLWKYMEDNDISYWDLNDIEEVDSTTRELFSQVAELDPKFSVDYTGTSWWIKECELV